MNTKQKTLFGGVREKAPFRPIETVNSSNPTAVASNMAAERARIRASGNAAKIRAAVHQSSPHGLTETEITAATGIPGNSVRPRRLRLIELGYLRILLGPDLKPILRDGQCISVLTSKAWPYDEAAGDGQ